MTDISRTAFHAADVAGRAISKLRTAEPATTVIYLEPDLHRLDHPDLVPPTDAR